MFFLLRMTFWLGLVLVLLPFGSAQQNSAANEVSASEAISAASATVGDLRGFCGRQPDACAVGSQVASTLGYRAQAGAKMLYEVLSEAMAPRETGSVGSALSKNIGGKAAAEKSAAERASQGTLTPADLAPAWRGPPARKDGKHAA
jgi:DNA-binding transcriptional regulator YdaS (Cro superfamily)